jgi:NAD kinase
MIVWIDYAEGENYQSAQQAAHYLNDQLHSCGITSVMVRGNEVSYARPELAVAVGGDGTVIQATKRWSPEGVPVIGLNAGDVGFLCAGETRGDWKQQIADFARFIADKQYQVEERAALQVNGYPGSFVNEVALTAIGTQEYPFALARYRVETETGVVWEQAHARTIILATQTGSTGLNASSGGLIARPGEGHVLTAGNPQTGDLGSMYIPTIPGKSLRITLLEQLHDAPVVLTADGKNIGYEYGIDYHGLKVGQTVTITMATQPMLLATRGIEQFETALREKKRFVSRT